MLSRRTLLKAACQSLLAPLARPSFSLPLPPPYLQDVRADCVTRCLLSELEAPDAETGGLSIKDASVLRLPTSETGLESTLYLHRMTVGNPNPARQTFRFLAFGDSGSGSEQQRALAERMLEEGADFVVHTGDLAYPRASYEEFLTRHFDVYARLASSIPFYPCPGNHEWVQPDAKPYRTLHTFPECGVDEKDRGCYYSFDWGPLHFISLDSNEILIAAVNGKSRMLEWLETDLKQNRQPFTVPYFHQSLYTGGPHRGEYLAKLCEERLVPLFERHGVRLVLNGHDHNYQRSRPLREGREASGTDGICYLITGGGGGGLYPTGTHPFVEQAASVHHYIRGTVEENLLRLEAVPIDGNVFDTIEFRW